MPKVSKKNKGILLMICSAFCFALMSAFVRLSGDLPSVQKSFFRNLVAAVFAAILLFKDKNPQKLDKKSLGFLLLRSFFGTVGILCNFYAVDHLLLADASILNKMSPFFAILCSYFLLKEKVPLKKLLLVFGAFLGTLFVIKPSFGNADFLPSLLGLLGGFAAGFAYTCVRKLGTMGVKGPFIVFFFSLFSCLSVLPYLLFHFVPMSGKQVLFLLLAGLAASGGQFSITSAYTFAPARDISVFDYSQIIFSSALGFFLFGQIPDGWSFLGYGIIILMAVLMFFMNREK